jgi:hypothetical protein
MSKVIIMSGNKLVNIEAVQSSTPLPQVYVVAMNFDAATKSLTKVKDSVFARVRSEARKVYELHLNLAKGDHAQLCGDAMCAEFKAVLGEAEAAYAGAAPDQKAKNTWMKNKTDLGRALRLRYDFVDGGEAGSSAICNWCKDEEDRIEEEVGAQKRKEHAEKHGLEITTSETKDVTVKGGDGNKQADDTTAGNKAVASATGIVFANSEQEARFNEMIELMAGISKIDPSELDGMINGSVTQLTAKNTKLLKLFAKAS